jgi:Tfp pilus assembly protein PilF
VYEKVVELEPNRPMVWCEIARLAHVRGDKSRAMDAYGTALEYDPRCVTALNSLGLIESHSGELDEAEGHLQRAVRVAPDHHGILCNYAGFLQVLP